MDSGLDDFNKPFEYTVDGTAGSLYAQAECDDVNTGSTTKTTQAAGYTGTGYNNFDVQVAEPLNVSIANAAADEADANAILTITLNKATSTAVTVRVDTADATATAGADYTAVAARTVTIAANTTSTTTTVPIINDTRDELTETFTATLSSPSTGLLLGTQTVATITITDNDNPPTITAEADKSVPEGDPNATSTVTVLVSLSTPSGLPVEVDFATQDGTATTANNDYDATSGTLTFAPGDAPKTISVTINGDEDIEADQTFSVVLSNATTSPNAAVAFTTDGTTEVTITNDDVNPNLTVPVVLQVSEPSDGATTTVKVRATISPQAWVAKDVVVTYSTANGSASASTDYVAQTGQTVTISGGQTFVDIEIVVKGDATQEGEENFFVNVTNATNANVTVSQTEVKIVEQPTLTIADPAPVNENAGTVSLTVTLNPTSSVQTTVTYSTANATAVSPGDYTARTNTLVTIPAGQSSATIAIPIANDVLDEDNETFTVTLDAGSETGTGTLGAALIGTPNAATVTITDDDDLPTLRIGDASVREEIASGTVSQTITLSPVSGRDVMVNYTTQDGTAKDGVSDADPADYVATSSVATIPAGSTFLTFNVTIVDDAIKEPDEVFNVVLSSPVNATLADASSAITIIDDEVRPEVSIDDVEVVEGANASFTISQDIVAGEDTLVDYDTSDGTATAGSDYTAVSDGTATIPAGSLSTTVVINTTDDSEEEDAETAVVTLSNARSVDPAGVVIKDGTGLLVINDNEPAAKIVTITSEGEAMPGDYYFVVTAGTPTNATGFVTLANVSVYLQKTYGLDEVRSKTATHVMLAQVPTSAPLGIMTHAFATGGLATDTDLLIVNERSNRNFYLFPGTNYTGVGLIPDASSDTFFELLAQTVPNAHPDYVAALKALDPANTKLDRDIVKLSDVIDMVFVYNGFNSFGSYSPSPVRLTNSFRNVGTASIVRAFQGMLIVGRDTLTDPSSTVVPVFDTASLSPTTYPVAVKMTVHGSFMASGASVPPTHTMRVNDFNLPRFPT